MVTFVKVDVETYNRTKGLSDSTIYTFVEEETPDIEMITDSEGNPTLGGRIGYALDYALMAGFIGYFVLFICAAPLDRKSVEQGNSVSQRVDLGGRRIIKNNTHNRVFRNTSQS